MTNRQGWMCPQCNLAHSPDVLTCPNEPPGIYTESSSSNKPSCSYCHGDMAAPGCKFADCPKSVKWASIAVNNEFHCVPYDIEADRPMPPHVLSEGCQCKPYTDEEQNLIIVHNDVSGFDS